MTPVLLASAAALAAGAVAVWAWSLRARDASVADLAWGPAFALVGWVAVALAPRPGGRGVLLAVLTTAWALRLTWHLARRRRSHPGGPAEDRRYRALRERHGAAFGRRSLHLVFLLQAALAWLVSLPLQAGPVLGGAAPVGPLGALGVACFLGGLACEALADWQLARFLRGPRSVPPAVMDRGLWRYSRHPNYFGDALLWWGLGLLAAEGAGAWVLAGPALMTVLLLRVSGVTLLESTIGARRPGYAAYVRRTSAFLPWPPRRCVRPAPSAPSRR